MQTLIDLFHQEFPLKKREVGEFSSLKLNGMKFEIEQYSLAEVGNLSLMRAKGFLGLMKMTTLIVTPLQKDAPLFSYDRVQAFGKDMILCELYDTLVESVSAYPLLTKVKEKYAHLPDGDAGEHWYDSIKREESLYKKGRKKAEAFDALGIDYSNAYCEILKGAKEAPIGAKRQKTSDYVNGLIGHGGPSTDVFLKAIGKEKTRELFERVLFGIVE